jgi:hypothetical protein
VKTDLIITGSSEAQSRLWDALRHLREANNDFNRAALVVCSSPINGHQGDPDTAYMVGVELDAYPYGRDIFAALAFASGVQIWKPIIAGFDSL